MATGEPFTALFAFNDISAIGAVRAFRDAGLRVPEDVSVVGFDDIQAAAYLTPRLTTVRQPLRQMGEMAARQLLMRISNGKEKAPYLISLAPELPGRPACCRQSKTSEYCVDRGQRTSGRCRFLLFGVGTLVNAHVIDQHALRWKHGGGVGVSGPVAAHRQIKKQEEWFVKDPLPPRFQVRACTAHVEIIVDVEVHGISVPLDSENVEVIRKALLAGQSVGRFDAGAADVSGAMDRAVNRSRLLTDVFHDVDFAARGPADFVDVIAEHPEGGPHALAVRNLDACFEASIGLGEFAQGLKSGRGVVSCDALRTSVIFRQRRDHQVPLSNRHIRVAIGVVLEFLVAPALAPGFKNPFGAIDGGSIEFVAPDQRPTGAIRWRWSNLRAAGYSKADDEPTKPKGSFPSALHGEPPAHSALRALRKSMSCELAHYYKQT